MQNIIQLSDKVDNLENKVDRVDTKVDKLETRFDNLEARFDNLETRFDNLETKFDRLDSKLDKFIDAVDKRFDDVDMEFKMLRIEVMTEFDRRLKPIETSISHLQSIAAANWNVPEQSARLDAVEHVVKKHTDQINLLNSTVGIA